MTKKVGIVGFGTIGKRLADYINLIPGSELVAIYKQTPDPPLKILSEEHGSQLKLYCPPNQRWLFESRNLPIEGNMFNLCEECDIILDCTPAGTGAENQTLYYSKYDLPVIFQGGEGNELIHQMFFSRINFDQARDPSKRLFKIPSCNTTGLLRLSLTFPEVEHVFATLLRRGADLKDSTSGPIASIKVSSMPSHHSKDVRYLLPTLDIETVATIVSTNLCHLHSIELRFPADFAKDKKDIIERFKNAHRTVFTGFDGLATADVMEWGRDQKRNRGDIYENIIFRTFSYDKQRLILFQAIHQESITIPETLECLNALSNTFTQAESEAFVDHLLSIKK